MNKKTVLIHSGGLDSTVLLWKLRAEGAEVSCLSFDYGQRHDKELGCALRLCELNGIQWDLIEIPRLGALLKGSSQTDSAVQVPEGHYAADNMKTTVVPNRNMIMLSIAAGIALARGAESVAAAMHAGDHEIYPDCRLDFVQSLNKTLSLADWKLISLHTPFIHKSKAQIVSEGISLRVPFENTWSCYNGRAKACGRCGTCVERLEAFHVCGTQDPLEYEDREFYLSVCDFRGAQA